MPQSPANTDWRQILALYGQLLAMEPTPVVALNRAVALAEVEGSAAGLAAVDVLELGNYYLFHAVRADLLRRLGRNDEAVAAYRAARERTDNDAERDFLAARARALTTTGPGLQHRLQTIRTVGDQAVHAHVQQPGHLGGIVDRPDVNLQPKPMRAPQETGRHYRQGAVADRHLEGIDVVQDLPQPALRKKRSQKSKGGVAGDSR